MEPGFALETPIWEIVLRASVVYLGLAAVLRIVPKRQTGSLAPNDILALVVIGSIAASAILGAATSTLDLMLKILVIVLWDYLFNLAEYHWKWFRKVAQDSPTLLVHEGRVLEANLRREKLTEQELAAALRERGIGDLGEVRQAVLEVDGRISVIRRDEAEPAP